MTKKQRPTSRPSGRRPMRVASEGSASRPAGCAAARPGVIRVGAGPSRGGCTTAHHDELHGVGDADGQDQVDDGHGDRGDGEHPS